MQIESAKSDVHEMYKNLQPIVDEVVNKQSMSIDKIVHKIKNNVGTLSNKEIQDILLQLSIETYYFSHIKDMSVLKQECALALMKDSQANIFNRTAGTQVVRSNQAVIESLDKQAVNILYNAVANNMKSKLDEAHRMVNIMSNLLISKNAEAKLRGVRDDTYNNDSPKDNFQ